VILGYRISARSSGLWVGFALHKLPFSFSAYYLTYILKFWFRPFHFATYIFYSLFSFVSWLVISGRRGRRQVKKGEGMHSRAWSATSFHSTLCSSFLPSSHFLAFSCFICIPIYLLFSTCFFPFIVSLLFDSFTSFLYSLHFWATRASPCLKGGTWSSGSATSPAPHMTLACDFLVHTLFVVLDYKSSSHCISTSSELAIRSGLVTPSLGLLHLVMRA
jgi:hypothetical protein